MTTLTATLAAYDAADAAAVAMDETFPGWEEREAYGERFLSERDFPIEEDVDGPTDADWDFFMETMWCDPAERAV